MYVSNVLVAGGQYNLRDEAKQIGQLGQRQATVTGSAGWLAGSVVSATACSPLPSGWPSPPPPPRSARSSLTFCSSSRTWVPSPATAAARASHTRASSPHRTSPSQPPEPSPLFTSLLLLENVAAVRTTAGTTSATMPTTPPRVTTTAPTRPAPRPPTRPPA